MALGAGGRFGDFVTTEKQEDFDKLVARVRDLGEEFYDDYECQVPLIATLKEKMLAHHDDEGQAVYFDVGTKFLYADGRLELRRDVRRFLNQNHPDYKISETGTHAGWDEGDDIEFDFTPIMTDTRGILKGLYGGHKGFYAMENELVVIEPFSFEK